MYKFIFPYFNNFCNKYNLIILKHNVKLPIEYDSNMNYCFIRHEFCWPISTVVAFLQPSIQSDTVKLQSEIHRREEICLHFSAYSSLVIVACIAVVITINF